MNKIRTKTSSAGTKPSPSTSTSSSSSSLTSHRTAPSTSSSSSSLAPRRSAPSTSSSSSSSSRRLASSTYSSCSSLTSRQSAPSTYSSRSSLTSGRSAPSTYSSRSSLTSGQSAPSTYSSRYSLTSRGSAPSTSRRPAPSTSGQSAPSTYSSRYSLTSRGPAPSTSRWPAPSTSRWPAPSTSPSSSSSSSTHLWKYDVFLCFCGRDTRFEFTDAVFEGMRVRGIKVFRDNEGMQRGEKINPALEAAIKKSRNAIVIVSPNFTKSKACMFELTKIMEHRRKGRLDVFPVFYHTDPASVPSVVPQLDKDPVESSTKALKELSNISAWVIRDESYTALPIDKICREMLVKTKEAYEVKRSSHNVA